MYFYRTVVLFAASAAAAAQAQTLHHRSPSAADAAPPSSSTGTRQALPPDAEGEYRWGEPGEVIELYVEAGALRGYLTRRSERGSAGSAPMTFGFAEAAAAGSSLSFTTRRIHGDWYSFKGQVVRGPIASPRVDGYYLLQGRLSVHLGPATAGDPSASDEPVDRRVTLKLSANKPRN